MQELLLKIQKKIKRHVFMLDLIIHTKWPDSANKMYCFIKK
ncbi:hypothetical protein C427_0680 [Paraglaciecola psychrophila 170]|uniref:Uncharacterized protein n=1 Tax=Paraglaciecola psychrophila 170 TaxID=1129794 RepID=K7A7A3_9ALTE|nr:hypothetical protein C427_0680 [Paraglaciecola psychrophila 170]GAC36683.1 hypothetical protein GPSY_1045 [Paraglaciecola psychrophila 170]